MMISRSFTYYLITLFCSFVKNSVKNSKIVRGLLDFSDYLSEKSKESGLYAWLGENFFEDKYEKSVVYSLAERIWQFVLSIVRKCGLFTRKIFDNSFGLFVFDFLKEKGVFAIDVFLAIFIGMMFIVPHEAWNNLYAFIAAVFFGAWSVVKAAFEKSKSKKTKVSVAMVAFAIAVVLSTVTAYSVSDALRIALFMVASVLICYCVFASIDTYDKLVRFVSIVLVFVTVAAAMGVVQGIRGVEVDLEFVDVTANEGMPGRVYSTFSNPNNFAELLILFLPFYAALFASLKNKTAKAVTLCGFVITVVALAMTYSRSCWVGFALAAVIFVALYDKRLLIPLVFVAICAVPFLPESIINRIFTIGSMEDSSNSYRLYIWESCLNMIKDYGLTGIGLGPESFKAIYPGYASPVAITAPHSHMLYMEIVIEMGLMGAVGFFAYIFATVKRAAGEMRVMTKEMKTFAVGAIGALGGIAFVCCAEYIWFYPRVMFAFWVVPGILMAIVKIAKNANR